MNNSACKKVREKTPFLLCLYETPKKKTIISTSSKIIVPSIILKVESEISIFTDPLIANIIEAAAPKAHKQ
jgi:hypothetical protein